MKEKLRNNIDEFKEWFKLNTQTRQERLDMALRFMLWVIGLAIALVVVAILWPVFVFLLVLALAGAIVFSPVIYWIVKGKK